jgi:hypothetical protein
MLQLVLNMARKALVFGSMQIVDTVLWWNEMHGGRGLHSFTSQLNLSACYGIGVARRGV